MMCGISAMFGRDWSRPQLEAMIKVQSHRGPDAQGVYESPNGLAGLGHNRLSIIDLSDAGRQPMSDSTGRYWTVFNGEIYNYLELRSELITDYSFHTRTDTEVLLAAYLKWGQSCLDRLIGMFAFLVWDEQEQRLFGARDRFGVKPLHYHETPDGGLWLASEIKALHAAGVPRRPDDSTWATYLVSGMYDHTESTFWDGIQRIPPGACFTWTNERGLSIRRWYDVAETALADGLDTRSNREVADELLSLLEETVRLRFRSDVPVGICLSGGLDSSLLLGLVHRVQGADSAVKTFTFYCGDPNYDEIPWVEQMLAKTKHPACYCRLTVDEVPALFDRVARYQDEPFGGLPTLGMAKVHERAVQEGVVVLLDGNGLDEGWAGYEYYQRAASIDAAQAPVQGSRDPSTRPDCLNPDFAALALGRDGPLGRPLERSARRSDPTCSTVVKTLERAPQSVEASPSALVALQYRDLRYAKIPRAMRFADRVSMQFSRELRDPFLDHRIIELGLRQPVERKIRNGQGKYLIRQLASCLLPIGVREAPKRPVQTPQREWLRGPLEPWVNEHVEAALGAQPTWFNSNALRPAFAGYIKGERDNSFFIWQWLSAGLTALHASSKRTDREG
jgi:asparagine synthase (glutamine-hydrolysing)